MRTSKHGATRRLTQLKLPNPIKMWSTNMYGGNPSHSDIPGWLQEFRENLVDERVPEHRDSHASSSHEPSLEPMRSADLGKHSVYTHFPKDRNCEICHQRTKITRAPSRRRTGEVVPRADKFGDMTTADHRVFGEGCVSRNNNQYAWIQSYPCKTTTSQETEGACKSSWSRLGN